MPKYLKLGKGTSGASLSNSSRTGCPRLCPAEFWFSPVLEAPQLLQAHVLVLPRLTGKIFLCLNGISSNSCLLHQLEAKRPNVTLIKSSPYQINSKTITRNDVFQCVYLKLQILSSASCPAQHRSVCGPILRVQFPFIPCQTGANTGDNTLSSEYFSKYEGIWKYTVLILMHYNHYCLSQWNSWQLV